MLMKKSRTIVKDVIYYGSGALSIAFGVVMLIKSTLGVGPWDSLFVSVARISPLTIGMSAIVILFMLTFLVMLIRRSWVYGFIFFPIFFVGALIDLFDLVILVNYEPQTFLAQALTFLSGILTIPLGGAMLMQTRFPAGVFEEVMLLIMELFNTTKMALSRMSIEIFPVIVTLLINGLFFNDIGSLSYGTVVYVMASGPLVQFYNKRLRRLHHEQTD